MGAGPQGGTAQTLDGEESMAASVIVKFVAADGKAEELKTFLEGLQPAVLGAGASRITLCQSEDDPNLLFECEEWESTAAHKAFVAAIPADAGAALQTLCAKPFEVTYCARVKTSSS